MQQKKSVRGFIEAVHRITKQGANGHIVLIGSSGEWGKLELHAGEITSLGYGNYRGQEALAQLKSQEELQFMFRSEKAVAAGGSAAESAPMTSEQFFGYFADFVPDNDAVDSSSSGGMTAPVPERASGRRRVLIVDDSALARKVAARVLLNAGYLVSEAVDGFDAMGQLENVHPDLVLLDLVMPGIDGYKVVDLMKGHERYAQIPIIMLTSRDSLLDKLKGKMSDSDAYITKPVKEDELLGTVCRLLGE